MATPTRPLFWTATTLLLLLGGLSDRGLARPTALQLQPRPAPPGPVAAVSLEQAFLQGCLNASTRTPTANARPYCRCYLESFRNRYPEDQLARIGLLSAQLGPNGQLLVALLLQPERDLCRRLVQPE